MTNYLIKITDFILFLNSHGTGKVFELQSLKKKSAVSLKSVCSSYATWEAKKKNYAVGSLIARQLLSNYRPTV